MTQINPTRPIVDIWSPFATADRSTSSKPPPN